MNILDIFYNSFIKEASLGTIEAFLCTTLYSQLGLTENK